jgi:hypothetical protein
MSRYPAARWRPIPEQRRQQRIRPTQFIFHTQAGYGSLHDYFTTRGIAVESHLWVSETGAAEQYLDTEVRGDANYRANRRPDGTGAVSCEFEGKAGDPFTEAQVATAVRLLRQAHQRDGIPQTLCRSPDDPGVGWHVMWGAPGPWTPVAKTCPGQPRIAQIPGIVRAAREEHDMPSTDELIRAITRELRDTDSALAVALRNNVRIAVQEELRDERRGDNPRQSAAG